MNDRNPDDDDPFSPEEMINASELREFLFCERAWYLSGQGYRVSAEAESQRVAGIAFHESRAAAAREGASPRVYLWVFILAVAASALIVFQFLMGGR